VTFNPLLMKAFPRDISTKECFIDDDKRLEGRSCTAVWSPGETLKLSCLLCYRRIRLIYDDNCLIHTSERGFCLPLRRETHTSEINELISPFNRHFFEKILPCDQDKKPNETPSFQPLMKIGAWKCAHFINKSRLPREPRYEEEKEKAIYLKVSPW